LASPDIGRRNYSRHLRLARHQLLFGDYGQIAIQHAIEAGGNAERWLRRQNCRAKQRYDQGRLHVSRTADLLPNLSE
jgi:hypothetical protein